MCIDALVDIPIVILLIQTLRFDRLLLGQLLFELHELFVPFLAYVYDNVLNTIFLLVLTSTFLANMYLMQGPTALILILSIIIINHCSIL